MFSSPLIAVMTVVATHVIAAGRLEAQTVGGAAPARVFYKERMYGNWYGKVV